MINSVPLSTEATGGSRPARIDDLQLLDPEDQHSGEKPSAADRFARMQGPSELHAALLALLLPGPSQRARRAWQAECADIADAEELREFAQKLPAADRLPWMESLLTRMRATPLTDRQALIASTRKIMGARGEVRPIDRLHWLAMRRRLGESPVAVARAPAARELSQLPQTDVTAIAIYAAFLAQMVPNALADSSPEARAPGIAWHAEVMAPWADRWTIPPCETPTSDSLNHALRNLQDLPWMQRPLLIKAWVTAALKAMPDGKLSVTAADALRLSCSLIDSPMPPELTRSFGLDPEQRRR